MTSGGAVPSARLGRRGLALAVVGCAVAAVILVLGASQVWLSVSLPADPPLPGDQADLTGQDLVPTLLPVGLLVGAAALALLATRRLGRIVVGAVLVGAGLLVAARVGFLLYDDGRLAALSWADTRAGLPGGSVNPERDFAPAPAVVALLACLVVVAVGVWTLRTGRHWPVMGARYERGSATPSTSVNGSPMADEATIWKAVERGEDPTAASLVPPSPPGPVPTRDRPNAER